MRKVTILVCDPRASGRLQEQICSHLEVHPETRLTWLQSSASRGGIDFHVLTCVAEYDVKPDKPEGRKKR